MLYGESSVTRTGHARSGTTVRSEQTGHARSGVTVPSQPTKHAGSSVTVRSGASGHLGSSATVPSASHVGSSQTVRAEPSVLASVSLPIVESAPSVTATNKVSQRRYDVFLSYSSDQRELADWIRGGLVGDGFTVFFDRKDIHYSKSFDQTIREAIEQSSVLVFLVSARSVHSDSYAQYELGYAFDLWSDGSRASRRILSVVAEPTETVPRELVEKLRISRGAVKSRLSTMVRRARLYDPRYRRRYRMVWSSVIAGLVSLCGVGLALAPSTPALEARPSVTAPLLAMSPRSTSVRQPSAPEHEELVAEPEPSRPQVRTLELDGEVELSFVLVPGGTTVIGSANSTGPSRPIKPQREVEISPFWLTRTEVTQAQWRAVMSELPGGGPQDCTVGCELDHPVHHVHHDDAARFANALSERLGRRACYEPAGRVMQRVECDGVYIPWESQWEHAARAGTTTVFSFGSDPSSICTYANGRDQTRRQTVSRSNADWLSCQDGYAYLAPVASLQSNPWGLYDMHGNVWEWADVDTPGAEERTILRGGSFLDIWGELRSSRRYRVSSFPRYPSVGFRVGLDRVPAPRESE